jgi:ribosomal protein L22
MSAEEEQDVVAEGETAAVADDGEAQAKEAEAKPAEEAAKKPATKKRAARKKPAIAEQEPDETAEAAEEPKEADDETDEEVERSEEPESRPARLATKKPTRRRVVRARARYVRSSTRKARMVCGHIRGKSVSDARAILAFTPREVARDWSKLLESAIANAEHNHDLLEDDLIVREAYADEGPTIKRFRPRAMGRATPIHKRTSHLTIALSIDDKRQTS